MVIMLKIDSVDREMQPLRAKLDSLMVQQQVNIRQLRDFEDKAILDRGLLPREAWTFSSRERAIFKVDPPTPRPGQ